MVEVGEGPVEDILGEEEVCRIVAGGSCEGDDTLGGAMDVMGAGSVEHPFWGVIFGEEVVAVEVQAFEIILFDCFVGEDVEVVQDGVEDETGVIVVVGDAGLFGRVGVEPGVVRGFLGQDPFHGFLGVGFVGVILGDFVQFREEGGGEGVDVDDFPGAVEVVAATLHAGSDVDLGEVVHEECGGGFTDVEVLFVFGDMPCEQKGLCGDAGDDAIGLIRRDEESDILPRVVVAPAMA